MIQFPRTMIVNRFNSQRRMVALMSLLAVAVLLTGCGAMLGNDSWPGMAPNGDSVYVAYGPGVVAVDIEAQSELWRYPAEASAGLEFYAAPHLLDGRLIFGDYGASGGFLSPGVTVNIYAVEETGGRPAELWTNDLVASDRIIAAPLQSDGKVFIGTADNIVAALDSSSGAELWRLEIGHAVWGQPAFEDGVLFIGSMDRHLHAIDAEKGSLIWELELDGAVADRPLVDNGVVYVGAFDNKVHAFSAIDGKEIWSAEASDWVWGTPAIDSDRLIFGDLSGVIHAVSLADGSQLWTRDTGAILRGAPLVVEDVVYFGAAIEDAEGQLSGALISIAIDDGTIQWQAKTDGPIYGSPVLVSGSIVVATKGSDALLVVFEPSNGNEVWSFLPSEG